MKRRTAVLLACLLAVLVAAPIASASSHQGRTVLEFDTMAPVIEPFTGAANPIRGVPGGGLPWEIEAAKGELRSDGRLEIEVRGLVLARRAPVPEALQGTNPVPTFGAIVSCLTTGDGGTPGEVNMSTGQAPATATGDSRIEAKLSLPTPCFAPIIFVTSPTGAWFAVTGH